MRWELAYTRVKFCVVLLIGEEEDLTHYLPPWYSLFQHSCLLVHSGGRWDCWKEDSADEVLDPQDPLEEWQLKKNPNK